jgi:chromate reductase, NAD(P)H dehydrogenase (quinone)
MLKNALDWASRPFPNDALRSEPVALIGASTALFGAVWTQAEAARHTVCDAVDRRR